MPSPPSKPEPGKKTMANVVELRPAIAARQRSSELTSSIGMMVALGSFAMMFGALFFVYAGLRAQSLSWPPEGTALPLGMPIASTAAILASSATLVKALAELRRGAHGRSLALAAATLALGAVFLGLQTMLWLSLWHDGVTAAAGTLGSVVWGLTILHAVHVVAGMAVLLYLLVAVARRRAAGGEEMHRRVVSLRLCGMFWHFVAAVWLAMFVAIFVT
jgi:heme/copper-type cytochrome/quinol oxidase subunit 3